MQMTIYEEIYEERERQDNKHGGPPNDDQYKSHDWLAFITKHTGRAVFRPWDRLTFRRQMIRIAALAVAAAEWCDRLGPSNASER